MVRRRRSSRKKRPSGAAGIVFFLFLVSLVAATAWLFVLPAGSDKETFVEITPGSSSSQIADKLEQAGAVRSRYAFDLVRIWKRGALKAGEYRFDRPATVSEVYARLARGDVFTLPVTLPEGSTRFDIAAKVAQAGFLNVTREGFLAATASEIALIADLDPHAQTLEGYLFPDTYRFQRKSTAVQIVAAMVHRFKTEAAQVGLSGTPPADPVRNIVTLASLVERETAIPSERPLVASVFANRLKLKMPLQTDPSVIYGLELQGKWRGVLYRSDLKADTLYNTYLHIGLPPGPIANPGLSSLRAALHPAATNYLYFVAAGADPQGQSRFAATLAEHNKNVAGYRQAVKQAGGR